MKLFLECANQHFGGSLSGKLCVTAGLGGMGGAQPLAITMNKGAALCIEAEEWRIDKRLHDGYCDKKATTLDEALSYLKIAQEKGEGLSIGLLGNAAEILPQMLNRNIIPDVLTDQTSAHDPLNGYYPAGITIEEAKLLRKNNKEEYLELASESIRKHVETMVAMQDKGSIVFDYGNNIRAEALKAGFNRAYSFKGFVPEYIRPLFCDGKGPFRWVALSGDEQDIFATDKAILELFPDDIGLHRWINMAQKKFIGRVCQLEFVGLDMVNVKKLVYYLMKW